MLKDKLEQGETDATDISELASALDPKALKFLQAAKISEIKAEVSQLVCNREPNRSSSASQNVPPTAKKKA